MSTFKMNLSATTSPNQILGQLCSIMLFYAIQLVFSYSFYYSVIQVALNKAEDKFFPGIGVKKPVRKKKITKKNEDVSTRVWIFITFLLSGSILASFYWTNGIDDPKISWPLLVIVPVFFHFKMHISDYDEGEVVKQKESLAYGMAMQYWYSFLKTFNEAEEKSYEGEEIKRVLLIPFSCEFETSDFGDQVVEVLDMNKVNEKPLCFNFPIMPHRINKRENIYKPAIRVMRSTDKINHLISYDFPTILKSSIGSSKMDNDELRRECVKKFVSELKKLLRRENRNNFYLVVYDPDTPDFNLADTIVNHIESKMKLSEIISSSSGSEFSE